jgi:hypothetical protein
LFEIVYPNSWAPGGAVGAGLMNGPTIPRQWLTCQRIVVERRMSTP